MQSTIFELLEDYPQSSSFGKTSPECSAPKTMPSDAFWQDLPAKAHHLSQQGENGLTQVLCLVQKGQSLGGHLTPNFSEWHNGADVVSLSQVLEQNSIHPRFFLSSRACAGILRRADKRGKTLPVLLHQALEAIAKGSEPLEPTAGT